MSKKLLSAVLAIAMVVSLCASLFTVGTSAATSYESDREALKESIVELFVKGPTVNETVIKYLIDTGVLTVVYDCNGNAITTEEEIERNKVFNVAYSVCSKDGKVYTTETGKADGTDVRYFLNDAGLLKSYDKYLSAWKKLCSSAGEGLGGEIIGSAANFTTDDSIALREITSYILYYAASAYYYGQDADELIVDSTFNAGRNNVVKSATKLVKDLISDLKKEIGAKTDKPANYADAYTEWTTWYHNNAYNPNYGVNPYGSSNYDEVLVNNWASILQGYNGYAFPIWYSFADMRADTTVAPLLNVFERLYRAAQTNNVEKVLYYDFVTGQKAELENAWNALCNALLAKYQWTKPTAASASEQIKAYHDMLKVVEFYDKYISDAYQNIYTSANQELLANVAMAKLVADFTGDSAIKIYAIGADYFNNLATAIVNGIAALDPAAAGLALVDSDIKEGTDLINEAQALLSYYSSWASSSNSSYKEAWNSLNEAVTDLKVMLPYDASSAAIYTIKANTSDATLDLDGSTKNTSNSAIVVTFTPNYFAFVRFVAKLEAALADMVSAIATYNNNIENLDKVQSSSSLDKAALKEVLLKYDFLAGLNLGYDKTFDKVYILWSEDVFFELYLYFCSQFIAGIVTSDSNLSYDTGDILSSDIDDKQAADQYGLFCEMFYEAIVIFNEEKQASDTEHFSNVKFKTSSWDWTTGTIGGEVNGYAAIAEKLVNFLPYITAELEEIINLYAFISDELARHFGFGEVLFGWYEGSNKDDYLTDEHYPDFKTPANYPGFETKTITSINSLNEWFEDHFGESLTDILDSLADSSTMDLSSAIKNFVKEYLDEIKAIVEMIYIGKEVTVVSAGEYYEAMMAYYELYALCHALDNDSNYKVEDSYVNASILNDAYNTFIKEIKDLLTDERGDKLVDEFVADVIDWKNTSFVKHDDEIANEPWFLYEKLNEADMWKALTLPEDAAEPYLYYTFTLAHVAEHEFGGNKYENGAQFTATIYNPLKNKSKALDKYNVSGYDREWSEKFAEIRKVAGYVLELIDVKDGSEIDSDIPLWYVLNVITALDDVLDEQDEHTTSAIEAYKVANLYSVIESASDKSVYDYITDTEEGAAVWAAYEAAYAAAIAAKYDLRMPKSEIDDVVAKLNAAVEALELVKKPESSSTTADLEAKIVEAEALLARADDLDTAAKVKAVENLKTAITDAKQFLVNFKYETAYNNSYDIDAQIADVQAAIDNVDDLLYFADDLAAYLGFVANAAKVNEALYTADSYAAFVLAYEAAKEVAAVTDYKASVYVAAKASVSAAYQALAFIPEPEMTKTFEAAVAKLAELKAVSTEGYTAESVAAFEAAVDALEAGIEEVADDDVLLELIANAYIAKAQLASVEIKNPITCDD